jgi:enoyl-CoA hydratase
MNYREHGEVAVLHFDDGKVNAVGHDFVDAMNRGLDRAGSEAKAVVILGMDGKFSAGFDLSEFKKGPEALRSLRDKGARMLLRVFSHPQPVVAGCSGHAIAAGALILLACDSRIGRRGDFKIGLNETAIGMVLPVFALELARARLSQRHLTSAVVQSQLYGPDQAVDAGFLDRVVDAQDLQQHCIDVASQLAQLPTESYAANKAGARAVSLERIRTSLE